MHLRLPIKMKLSVNVYSGFHIWGQSKNHFYVKDGLLMHPEPQMPISLGDECTVMHIHRNKIGKLQKKLGEFLQHQRDSERVLGRYTTCIYICEKDIWTSASWAKKQHANNKNGAFLLDRSFSPKKGCSSRARRQRHCLLPAAIWSCIKEMLLAKDLT